MGLYDLQALRGVVVNDFDEIAEVGAETGGKCLQSGTLRGVGLEPGAVNVVL